MHLINETLQAWKPLVTREELRAMHADKLQEIVDDNPKNKNFVSSHNVTELQQLEHELSQSRKGPLAMEYAEKFQFLLNKFLKQKEKSSLSHHNIKRLDRATRNTIMDCIDEILEEAKILKKQLINLEYDIAQVGIEGGVRNQKNSEQAKLLQAKARELRTQLGILKEYPNEHIQACRRHVTAQLDSVIDKVSQIVEETERNRNLVDGLGLETKPSNGKSFSPQEGADIIADHEIGLTWKEVSDEEAKKRVEESLTKEVKLVDSKTQFNQVSDDAQTDLESDSGSEF